MSGLGSSFPPPVAGEGDVIRENLPLVYRVIHQMGRSSIPHDEMVSAGMIGLLRAVRSYDPSKRSKWSSYAGVCIKNSILLAIRSSKSLKNTCTVSLDTPIQDMDGVTIKDVLPDPVKSEDQAVAEIAMEHIEEKLSCMAPTKQAMIRLWIQGYSRNEIAKRIGVTHQHVSKTILDWAQGARRTLER